MSERTPALYKLIIDIEAAVGRNKAGATPLGMAVISLCEDAWRRELNARLIVAAPDMLAALKAYARWFDDPATCDDPTLRPLRKMVLAAIAKAEGSTKDEEKS